jgi:hypothetical protein
MKSCDGVHANVLRRPCRGFARISNRGALTDCPVVAGKQTNALQKWVSEQTPGIFMIDARVTPHPAAEWHQDARKSVASDRRKMAIGERDGRTGGPRGPELIAKTTPSLGPTRGASRTEKYHLLRRWRREWDSNPRYGFPYTRFPSVRLKPLGHPSEVLRQAI